MNKIEDKYTNNIFEELKIALSWINSWVRFFLFLLPKAFIFVLTYGMIVMAMNKEVIKMNMYQKRKKAQKRKIIIKKKS